MDAKSRKRDAVGNLRTLAQELGVDIGGGRRMSDLVEADFLALHQSVAAQTSTPEQQQRVSEAMHLYKGTLPAVPKLPALRVAVSEAKASGAAGPALGAEASADASADHGFRLRSTSCLFTWNNESFTSQGVDGLWQAFLAWLATLSFVCEWTATAELSLKSKTNGRLHLHAFLVFYKAVDWTTLEKVRFHGSLPNASPTRARGDNVEQVKDQGHFYCWAWKPGTLKVQTSGYEPWQDYQVKGSWLDELWLEYSLWGNTFWE
jgi:hypothetical protein